MECSLAGKLDNFDSSMLRVPLRRVELRSTLAYNAITQCTTPATTPAINFRIRHDVNAYKQILLRMSAILILPFSFPQQKENNNNNNKNSKQGKKTSEVAGEN